MSISFHTDDNNKLTYEEADKIAREFAYKFFWSKGYEAMWVVHTDTEHIHVHFIVSNCNVKNGKSFRRGLPELKEMSQFFGEQCRERGLAHSVRDKFYNEKCTQERKSFTECQMQKHDKLSFKEEIKTYVSLAMNSTEARTLYDYEEWREETKKGGDSFYEAFDRFQADNNVSENDEEIFYGSVFQEFNEQWHGKREAVSEKKSEIFRQEKVDYSKLSLEEHVKLLPPPIGDQMTELKEYQKRMGYDESKMKSMKYKMAVYNEFLKEYEYRKKHYGVEENIKKKQRERER